MCVPFKRNRFLPLRPTQVSMILISDTHSLIQLTLHALLGMFKPLNSSPCSRSWRCMGSATDLMNNSLISKRGLRFLGTLALGRRGESAVPALQKPQAGPAWGGGHWAALIDWGGSGSLELFSQVPWLSQVSLRLDLCSSFLVAACCILLFYKSCVRSRTMGCQRSCNSTLLCLQ